MKELLSREDISYYKLESPREVDKIDIPEEEGGFDFFHGLGIIGYDQAFKMWLRKFPRPVLIIAVQRNTVVGWVYVEEWNEVAYDLMPVYVLRAIEIHPDFRRMHIGCTLLMLVLKETNGYVIAKPLTSEGESFFKEAGFKSADDFRKVPLDISKQPKYLILSPYMRDRIIDKLNK